MGIPTSLRPNCKPDDDKLLQATLLLNNFQLKWRGISQDNSVGKISDYDIANLDQISLSSGYANAEVFSIRISTELHRLMYHCGDQIRLDSCNRRAMSMITRRYIIVAKRHTMRQISV